MLSCFENFDQNNKVKCWGRKWNQIRHLLQVNASIWVKKPCLVLELAEEQLTFIKTRHNGWTVDIYVNAFITDNESARPLKIDTQSWNYSEEGSENKSCQITRSGQLKEREWLFRGQMWRKSWRSRWARKAMRQVGAAPARLSYQPAGHESMWEPASWRVLHKKRGREISYTQWVPGILGIGNSLVWSGNMVLYLKYNIILTSIKA